MNTENYDKKIIEKKDETKFMQGLLKLRRTQKHLWIEATSNSIGCIATSNNGTGAKAIATFYKENKTDGIEDSHLFNANMRHELQKFINKNRFRGIKTTCILPKEPVKISIVNFPKLPSSKLRKAIGLSVAGKLGVPENEICFDYFNPQDANKTNKPGNIITVAAKVSCVSNIIEAVEGAGCIVEDITFPLHEYSEMFDGKEDHNSLRGSLVIDIGKEASSLIFFDGNKPVYWREEQKTGEQNMLSALDSTISVGSGVLRLSREEAEQLIFHYGISSESGEEDITGKKMPLFQLYSMLRPYVERLVSTTRIAISRFKKEHEDLQIGSIYICGCGSYMKGLPEYFNKVMNIPAKILPAWNGLLDDNEKEQNYKFNNIAVVASRRSKGLSLVPRNAFVNKLITIGTRAASFIMVLIFGVLIVFYSGIKKQTENYRKILSKTKTANNQEVKITNESGILSQLNASISWYKKAIEEIPSSYLWMGILGDLAQMVPDDMRLERVVFSNKSGNSTLEISGSAKAKPDGVRSSAFDCAKSLINSPSRKERINVSEQEMQTGILQSKTTSFEIKCVLRNPPPRFSDRRIAESRVEKGLYK